MKYQPINLGNKKGGFFWWLLWIIIAITSFIFSATVWTWGLTRFFGKIEGTLYTIIWASAVFGTWLLTMIPIVRSKERYWNRLSEQDENNVTWWIGWMALTIATFFIAAGFWTWFFARGGGSIKDPGATGRWVFAVFGTWLIALVPLIITMYKKVDRAYEKAQKKKEMQAAGKQSNARSIQVTYEKRALNPTLTEKLKDVPATLKRGALSGHLMAATLKDGRKFDHVYIANGKELLGVYGESELSFAASEIEDLQPVDLDKVPAFTEENWLRLDGK